MTGHGRENDRWTAAPPRRQDEKRVEEGRNGARDQGSQHMRRQAESVGVGEALLLFWEAPPWRAWFLRPALGLGRM